MQADEIAMKSQSHGRLQVCVCMRLMQVMNTNLFNLLITGGPGDSQDLVQLVVRHLLSE